jgi:hypothetical protein
MTQSWHRQLLFSILSVGLVIALGACTEVRRTAPERTATEQLLISTAIDEAVQRLEFSVPAGASVYFETRYIESYDSAYLIGEVRAALARQVSALSQTVEGADVIVEVRVGAASINRRRDYVGLGGFELPIPLSDSVHIPELVFAEDRNRTGIAKLSSVTYRVAKGQTEKNHIQIGESGPVYGLSWVDKTSILGIGWRRQNLLPDSLPDDLRRDGRDGDRTRDSVNESS